MAMAVDPQLAKWDDAVKTLADAVASGDDGTAENIVVQLAALNAKLDIDVVVDLEHNCQGILNRDAQFKVKVQVEDREAAGACLELMVQSSDTIEVLKRKVWLQYKFPIKVQRWIVNKRLPDDNKTLSQCNVRGPMTLFLYLLPAHSVGLGPEWRDKFGRMDDESSESNDPEDNSEGLPSGSNLPQPDEEEDQLGLPKEANGPGMATGQKTPSLTDLEDSFYYRPEEEVEDGVWKCPVCDMLNSPVKFSCQGCYQSRLTKDVLREIGGLRIGDSALWPSDDGNERGKVKWIGVLPDSNGRDISVGLHFVNPVGTGTGKYKDMRLFHAPQGHAALLPLLGIMKCE